MLDSWEFGDEKYPDRVMYVNDIEDGGASFVLHNAGTKNVIIITKHNVARLIEFLQANKRRSDEK